MRGAGRENNYNWSASVGGCGGGAHLRRDEARVDARAGEGSVYIGVSHHGKRTGVRTGDGQRRSQRRGGWREARKYSFNHLDLWSLIHL